MQWHFSEIFHNCIDCMKVFFRAFRPGYGDVPGSDWAIADFFSWRLGKII